MCRYFKTHMSQVYDQDRISKISKIMPQFNKVAEVGDQVLMGLEGDPSFPYAHGERPEATIMNIERDKSGTQIQLRMANGSTKMVNEFSIAPSEVWEYSDASFARVMDRERAANEKRMAAARAERSVKAAQSTKYRGESSGDRGDQGWGRLRGLSPQDGRSRRIRRIPL